MQTLTKVGVATASTELVNFIRQQVKEYLGWEDLNDTPALAGSVGKYLGSELNGGQTVLSWQDFPSFGLQWETATTDVTALDKVGYLASGGITITLPEDPTVGTLVAIADRFSQFDTSPVTVVPSGDDTIEDDISLVLDLKNAYVQLIFAENKWEITQVSHPYNISEITEENFAAGNSTYLLSRVPPSRQSLLITRDGKVVPTSEYSVVGNLLSFGSIQSSEIYVRHLGVPGATKVADAPVGIIGMFPHNILPDGWLACRGQVITRSVYPELADYLNKGSGAELATLPDYSGDVLQVWDPANAVPAQAIDAVLNDGKWGRWLTSTEPSSTMNLWDNDTATSTYVNFQDGYIGYAFDAPVNVTQVQLYTEEPLGDSYLPTSIILEASDDGLTWSPASISSTGGSNINNQWYSINSTDGTPHRYWRIKGTGGSAYPDSTGLYWRVTACVFTGTTTAKYVGQHLASTVGAHNHDGITSGPSEYTFGMVQASLDTNGTDYQVAVLSRNGVDPAPPSSGNISNSGDGLDTYNMPAHSTVVAAIKAFSYQGGSLTTSEVNALREEVAALRAIVEG